MTKDFRIAILVISWLCLIPLPWLLDLYLPGLPYITSDTIYLVFLLLGVFIFYKSGMISKTNTDGNRIFLQSIRSLMLIPIGIIAFGILVSGIVAISLMVVINLLLKTQY